MASTAAQAHIVSRPILVIGCRGTVGSAIVAAAGDRAIKAGRPPVTNGCVSFDALIDDVSGLFARLHKIPKATVIAFGVSGTHACAADPVGSRYLNVDRVIATAESAAEAGSMPVVLSSDSVFDGTPAVWSEQDKPNPICEYGRQRFALERRIADLGIPYLLVRLSRVIADHANRRDLLFQWCDQMRRDVAIQLPTDQFCTPIAAQDVGRIVVQLIDAGLRGLVHLAGPERVSSPELFERLQRRCAQVGVKAGRAVLCRVADLPGVEIRPAATMLSICRLQGILAPHFTSLDDSINSVVAAAFPVRATSPA